MKIKKMVGSHGGWGEPAGDRARGRLVTVGILSLLLTTVLWASSFPFIKIVVTGIGGARYVWLRSLIAMLGLSPYVAYKALRGGLGVAVAKGGLVTGIAYALGLWLQGWGTGLTTASNSAFITGLNVVFIHVYEALFTRRYSWRLGASLAFSIAGLYLLTRPTGGLGLGDMLVLVGAVAWAAQVILVDKYSRGDPLVFVFFEMAPALGFILLDSNPGNELDKTLLVLPAIIYLGLVCSDIAFAAQVYGQRFVRPAIAGLVFLLEPVLAAVFSNIVLSETLTPQQIMGAVLILLALFNSMREVSR
ncbi:MAG: DMT family transporter [Pyrodictiaceae archaeon]